MHGQRSAANDKNDYGGNALFIVGVDMQAVQDAIHGYTTNNLIQAQRQVNQVGEGKFVVFPYRDREFQLHGPEEIFAKHFIGVEQNDLRRTFPQVNGQKFMQVREDVNLNVGALTFRRIPAKQVVHQILFS